MIKFPCPDCQATLRAPDGKAGARTRCPRRGGSVRVPGCPVSSVATVTTEVLPVESAAPDPQSADRQGSQLWIPVVAFTAAALLFCSIGGAVGLVAYRNSSRRNGDTGRPIVAGLLPQGVDDGGKPVAVGFPLTNDAPTTATLRAQKLYAAYTGNEAAADLNYTGKRIEFVEDYSPQFHKPVREPDGHYSLTLRDNDLWFRHKAAPEPTVVVHFRGTEVEKLARLGSLTPGDRLVMRGSCQGLGRELIGYRSHVVVQDATLSVAPKQVVKVRVVANQPWQDTGVNLSVGSKVTIVASGNWRKGTITCTGAGFSNMDDPQRRVLWQLEQEYNQVQNQIYPPTKSGPTRKQRQEREEKMRDLRQRIKEESALVKERTARLPVSNLPLMSLIGRVGPDGAPFAFPRNQAFVSQQNGRLFFQGNDADLGENSGSLEVEITVVAP